MAVYAALDPPALLVRNTTTGAITSVPDGTTVKVTVAGSTTALTVYTDMNGGGPTTAPTVNGGNFAQSGGAPYFSARGVFIATAQIANALPAPVNAGDLSAAPSLAGRGAWVSGTVYAGSDIVTVGAFSAVCTAPHTAGASFLSDLQAGRWSVIGAYAGEVTPEMFGARGDDRQVRDARFTANSTTVTSATAAFTNADVGKSIDITDGGGPGVQVHTTITSVQSPTAVTVAGAPTATVSTGVSVLVWGHDDTAALRSALDAAFGRDLVCDGLRQYRVDGGLLTTRGGNAQLPLLLRGTAFPEQDHRIPVTRLRSAGVRRAVIRSSLQGATFSAANGIPAVLGGPGSYGTAGRGRSGGMDSQRIEIDRLVFVQPDNPSLTDIDLEHVGQASVTNVSIATDREQGAVDTASNIIREPTHPWAAGYLSPVDASYEHQVIGNLLVAGRYLGSSQTEHSVSTNITAYACKIGWRPVPGAHLTIASYLSTIGCQHNISGWDPQQGAVNADTITIPGPNNTTLTIGARFKAVLDVEHQDVADWRKNLDDLYDPGSAMVGELVYLGGYPLLDPPKKIGGSNVLMTVLGSTTPVASVVTGGSDNFDRADAATLGAGWTNAAPGWGIAGNKAKGSTGSTSNRQIAVKNASSPDVTIEFDVTSVAPGTVVGLLVRYVDVNNYAFLGIYTPASGSDGNLFINQVVNGNEASGLTDGQNVGTLPIHVRARVAGGGYHLSINNGPERDVSLGGPSLTATGYGIITNGPNVVDNFVQS